MTYRQVKFHDNFEKISDWCGGIAIFEDEENTKLVGIICGCCGGFLEPEDIVEYEILPWITIEEEIRGEE